jgi:hypothetical protein
MEKQRDQRYVASLEQVIRKTHLDLRETMIQFQGYSQRLTSEGPVPSGVITDIRRAYKGIHEQLTKIKGISQLLETRYRQYYRRDSLRDKEISEFAFLARNLYTRFESILQEIEARNRLKDTIESPGVLDKLIPSQWFRFRKNEAILQRNLRSLYELDYKTEPTLSTDRRPRVVQDKLRSLSLFALSGEERSIDALHSRMRLREHDIKERYANDELRGALTHLRQVSVVEVKGVIRRFIDHREIPRLKCLLFSLQSQDDLGKEILGSADNILRGMRSGEVKTIPMD